MNIKTLQLLAIAVSITACGTLSNGGVTTASSAEAQKGCLYASKEYSVGERLQSKQTVLTESGDVEIRDYPDGDWLLCTQTESGGYRWIKDN
ncbi:hypothetical protein N7931_05935 [Catenovulum sp. 2E275]|uniref:hypothetical protein n=1 Tax=Catenovulum sp. 2E275 TaxID=2980497 RepID=UPI0021D11DFB|nr:hypothetical protein [Catenovulum sp. 2E275]MCU4675169.1 hypothetical protein [Catenovulum sp. 2E275]